MITMFTTESHRRTDYLPLASAILTTLSLSQSAGVFDIIAAPEWLDGRADFLPELAFTS